MLGYPNNPIRIWIRIRDRSILRYAIFLKTPIQ
uniref:Uncharacterized protein n=1 Tax=Arundo donax TaxID=35708 RepID=A0A0A9C3U4_ARUDO